ncbi:MAG: hypothetical protein J6A59_18960 [Lachnospiraceae bacterium]|nr:hypothetical protein [Lachnospiraceae bacterium]
MNEVVGKFIRVDKRTAEMMYYNGMGIILNSKNNNPLHKGCDGILVNYSNNNERFENLLNHFTFNNGEAWFWADVNNKAILDKRKEQYRKLKSYRQTCAFYKIDINKQISHDAMHKLVTDDIFEYINIIYDYIIKYKPVSINCLTDKKDIMQLDCFLKQFKLDEEIYYTQLFKIMKQVGFK